MKCSPDHVSTPVYLKLDETMPWPEDPVFYLLTRDGQFLCRRHPFFQSCVAVERGPGDLAGQKPFLRLSYPPIPRRLLEQIVGFFDLVGEIHGSEAAVLLAWDAKQKEIVPVVPKQVGTVSTGWYGDPFPMDLSYEIPLLPPHLALMGDIHSHVDGPAYASSIDQNDELHRPGLHIVVGRIRDEPPQFHCEVTVDGVRFPIKDLSQVCEGYVRRSVDVPDEWLGRLTVKPWKSSYYDSSTCKAKDL